MSSRPKLIALAGSLRRDSYNKKLVKIAAEGARKAGAHVTYIDLKDYPMPIFDQDIEVEKGMDSNAQKLKNLFIEHDGFLISSPEYNSSISAALKNCIDWISRSSQPDEKPLAAFKGKCAILMSASMGNLGGLRGLVHLRSILGNIGVTLLPDQYALASAHDKFDDNDNLKDQETHKIAESLGVSLAEVCKKLYYS
jgi:chromate reductase, NAD(P)H dehydrogenase (quinone)